MILADIGNTSVHFGIERNNRLVKAFRLYNRSISRSVLKKKLKEYRSEDILICSVAPSVASYFKDIGGKVYFVGRDLTVPVKSFYNKKDIGQDRLVNVFAAVKLYPKAKIIIDFGTALTVDFISKDKDYLGGFILPGIRLYLESLKKCELLSKRVKLVNSRCPFIPKDTISSISCGTKEGFSLMVNSFVDKYKRKLKAKQNMKNIKIIVTGGEGYVLRNRFNFSYIYDPLLTLKGLLLLKEFI